MRHRRFRCRSCSTADGGGNHAHEPHVGVIAIVAAGHATEEDRDRDAHEQRHDAADQQALAAMLRGHVRIAVDPVVVVEQRPLQARDLVRVEPALDRGDALALDHLEGALALHHAHDARRDAADDGDDGNAQGHEGNEIAGAEVEHGRPP